MNPAQAVQPDKPVSLIESRHKRTEQSLVSGCAVQHLLDEGAVRIGSQLFVKNEGVNVSVQAQLPRIERSATFQTSTYEFKIRQLVRILHCVLHLRHDARKRQSGSARHSGHSQHSEADLRFDASVKVVGRRTPCVYH